MQKSARVDGVLKFIKRSFVSLECGPFEVNSFRVIKPPLDALCEKAYQCRVCVLAEIVIQAFLGFAFGTLTSSMHKQLWAYRRQLYYYIISFLREIVKRIVITVSWQFRRK